MPLAPEDVHKKTFTPVRLREGYDMGEVDQFLDEVEVELTRLTQENEELQAKLGGASGDSTEGATVAAAKPISVPEAAGAAARLLEIAAQNADQLVAESSDRADKIIGEATIKAERREAESKSKAEQWETDARTRVERLDAETASRREDQLGALEQSKASLTEELEELRAFERETRARLKEYFESRLRALDGELDPETGPTSLGAASGDASKTDTGDDSNTPATSTE